jgi:hypothetical protein
VHVEQLDQEIHAVRLLGDVAVDVEAVAAREEDGERRVRRGASEVVPDVVRDLADGLVGVLVGGFEHGDHRACDLVGLLELGLGAVDDRGCHTGGPLPPGGRQEADRVPHG